MLYLGLDVATRFGWAFGPGAVAFGADSLPDVPEGRLLTILADEIVKLCERRRPDQIGYEAPFYNPKNPQLDQWTRWTKLCGVVQLVSWRLGLGEPRACRIGEIRSWFTGHGWSKKPVVIAECARRGWDVRGDGDAADALACMALMAKLPRSFQMEPT